MWFLWGAFDDGRRPDDCQSQLIISSRNAIDKYHSITIWIRTARSAIEQLKKDPNNIHAKNKKLTFRIFN
jgi:hypothetical protein